MGRALARANAFVSKWTPDPMFVPVDAACDMVAVARHFRINSLAVAVAASLFQRVARRMETSVEITNAVEHVLAHGIAHANLLVTPAGTFCLDASAPIHCKVAYAMCLSLAVKALYKPASVPRYMYAFSLKSILYFMDGSSIRTEDAVKGEMWLLGMLDWTILHVTREAQAVVRAERSALLKAQAAATACAMKTSG